ncbi:MAG: hypothetical protein B7Z78_08130 [Rhodospirillales bacterium 20-60-12]|nr:MAG: hypothetical protein B7Z78_08130 [Rhodospirillales bacterium 20-60-12]
MTDRFSHCLILGSFGRNFNPMMEDNLAPGHLACDHLSPHRRAQILAGAAEIFDREGYEGASMAQIAHHAKVSKGTLYNYFPSKQALFTDYVVAACVELGDATFTHPEISKDLVEVLTHIGTTMLRMMISPRGLSIFRVVVMEAAKFPDLALNFYQAGPAMMLARLADFLTQQHAIGALNVPDPAFAAQQFFALTQSKVVFQARLNLVTYISDAEIADIVGAAVNLFLAYYRTS